MFYFRNNLQMRYELNTTTPNVMAFSIYGNYYDCTVDLKPDEDDGGDGAAAALHNSFFVIMGIFLINLLL